MESYIMNNDNEESYFSDPYENRYSAWMPPVRYFTTIIYIVDSCG